MLFIFDNYLSGCTFIYVSGMHTWICFVSDSVLYLLLFAYGISGKFMFGMTQQAIVFFEMFF